MNKIIVCVGCSWTYGHGLTPEQTYPAHLQDLLKDYTVINAGHCGSDIGHSIFSAIRLIEEYNPCMVIFQLTTFDRITIGTDGFDNFLSNTYYDGRSDEIYFEDTHLQYKRIIGITDNIKTKITHGSYIANNQDINDEFLNSKAKNLSVREYKTFVSALTENIIHSNYTHQRVFSELFLFQKYLELKNIKSKYFYWLPYEGAFKENYYSNLFNSLNLIKTPVTRWFRNNYLDKNFYIDTGFHLSDDGNKILAEMYLLPFLKTEL
jgi:hypothetical protein